MTFVITLLVDDNIQVHTEEAHIHGHHIIKSLQKI